MNLTEKTGTNCIIEYLKKEYTPLAIMVYGSYADGSQNENSDFDALVISKNHEKFHDVSFVDGIQLDVFVYPSQYFEEKMNYEEFVQIFDSKIVMDTNEYGASFKNKVLKYIDNLPTKSLEDLQNDVAWCEKMVLRTKRNDAEGIFRWHWVLKDSLEIFCDIVGYPYRGPKKSLSWMKVHYPKAFECYVKAMSCFDVAALKDWIHYLKQHLENK